MRIGPFLAAALCPAVLLGPTGAVAGMRLPPGSIKAEAGRRAFERTSAAEGPTMLRTAHGRGNIRLALSNTGTLGTFGEIIVDPFTGEALPSCEYPRGSDIVFLYVAAFWIGAIVEHDTLVSCGSEDNYNTSEFWPDPPDLGGNFRYGSIDPNSKFYSPDVQAHSEEDIIISYTDTVTSASLVGRDPFDGRGHIPLGLEILQRSMAWSYSYADDFILFDYQIKNIGDKRLRKVYMSIWVDGDTWHTSRNNPEGWDDDIAGFYRTHPAPEGCGFIDTVNIAWHADNDGDPIPAEAPTQWDYRSAKGIVGTRVVRTPRDSLAYSFNWWIWNPSDPTLDFGPRTRGTPERPFRPIGAGLGTPEGDRSRYHVMSNHEFDYDLMMTALDHTFEGFLPPPPLADVYAHGFDCRYLLSFGPFDLEPGQSLPITFAWVGGEDFHRDATDFARLFDPENPLVYYDQVDFSQLALNARWASWVYDNPGVDTDGDGYYGKYRLCLDGLRSPADSVAVDTFWYEGDNVPDFRGAGPPSPPKMHVIPSWGKLIIRWNGFYSETTRDVFTRLVDFEGYRVYAGLDDRPSSFSVLHSYDRENFSRLVWQSADGAGTWKRDEAPYTLDELRQMYLDSTFDPLEHTRTNPLTFDGQTCYFEAQDFNQSDLSDLSGIHKVYPEAPYPGTDSTAWQPDDLVYDYDRPLPKYFEYELVVDNLLPSISYCVAVTAFDFGSPSSGLEALETKPENNFIEEFPQHSPEEVLASELDVFVYPNPYRLDAGYAEAGFENRRRDIPDPERGRRVHFSNLPPVCTISIFSLDGDLIRQLDHNYPEAGPGSMHDSWDLITRNSQTVVSGLYYWVVESPERTQVGKLAIVK